MHPSLSPAHEAEASRPRARPKLKVVYRRRADLRLDPDNARTHSPEQVEQLAAAMRRWGFTSPILLRDDDATIGAGHGRWEASGLAEIDPVPTITLHGLTDEEWRAYAIADNKLALNAGWDVDRLADQLAALEPELASLTGFSDEEMRELYASVEEATAQLGGVDTSFRYEQQFAVIVACADEAEQQRHFEALTAAGYACKVVVT